MSKSKDKGRRFENYVADFLTDNGLPSERIPLSGSLGAAFDSKYDSDVVIGTPENIEARIECKHRETVSRQLWEWLDGNDYLAVKRNHHQPLIIMPLDEFAALYKKAKGNGR